MDIKFQKLDNVVGEITVTLEEKDYADKVKKQIKEIGKERSEPGFRKGHVPDGLLKKKYGAAVKFDVVNRAIADGVYDYIKENNLAVLAQPVPEKDNIYKEEDTEYTFKFKVGLAPEFDDHVNKDLHVPYYEIEVKDDLVNAEINALRQRFGRQVSGEETEPNAVIKGVISELNPDGTIKEGGIVVENGILSPVHFTSDEQKKLFDGKHKGDVVVFNPAATCNANPIEMSSMLNIDRNEVEEHKGDFSFEITDIIVLKPAELDQEFFDNAVGKDKAHNEEELKEAVKNLIALNFSNDSNYKFSIDARDLILKAVGDIELPVEILKEYLIKQNEGLTEENIDEEFEKMRPQIIWDLVKEKIEKKFEVKVTEEDIKNEARGIVIRQLSQYGNGALTEQLVNHYADEVLKDEKNRRMMVANAVNRKDFDVIKENVTLDNKQISLEEFRNFFRTPEA